MPRFTYTIRNLNGDIITDNLIAADLDQASGILKEQRFQILKLKLISKSSTTGKTFGKLSTLEKGNLCRYLATMIEAGLPLTDAIASIAQDATNPTLKNLLADAQNGLQQGESLSDIFSRHPQIFDQVFVTVVRAGEKSGTLHQSFKYLQDQLIASHELSQKVKNALIYPAVIIGTMVAVGTILIVFVVPQIAQVFLSSKLPIPQLTLAILRLGLAINKNLAYIGGALLILGLSLIIAVTSNQGKRFLSRILKQLPIVTKLFEKLDLARFSRTLATLMQSGVPITQSLDVATITLTHKKYAPLISALKTDIKTGVSIASILRHHHSHIPQMMISMIDTGEKTGQLDKLLFEVAHFFEQELENEVKNFTAILEPVVMLVIGIGVGGMVISVIAPIYSLVSSLQHLQ